jgi:PAS domain S-box-containing protein
MTYGRTSSFGSINVELFWGTVAQMNWPSGIYERTAIESAATPRVRKVFMRRAMEFLDATTSSGLLSKGVVPSRGKPRNGRVLVHRGEPLNSPRALGSASTRGHTLPIDSRSNVRGAAWQLHEEADNFKTLFHTSPTALAIVGRDSLLCREINEAYERCTGYRRSEVVGKPCLNTGLWSEPAERAELLKQLNIGGTVSAKLDRFRTKSGALFSSLLSVHSIRYGGEACAILIAEDVTVVQQAAEAREELIQRLVNAQELERTRVARELHDSIGQSIALFGMELETVRLNLALPPDGDATLGQLCAKVKKLGTAVASLSHQLHSSELEFLGLAVAIRGLCREFEEQYTIHVDCLCSNVPDNLDASISLGLFRVTQEALHNVAKHSRAKKMSVEVRGNQHSMYLRVCDDGVGFSPNGAPGTVGLGLTSMRERIVLNRGDFTITSQPGRGTCIEASVPFRKVAER